MHTGEVGQALRPLFVDEVDMCQSRTSPPHWLPRVGQLESTSMVRNGLGCGNVGHKIIITSRQYGPKSHVQTKAHNRKMMQKHVHGPLSEAGLDAAQTQGVPLGCVVMSVSEVLSKLN